jgi:hypothetical protein
VAIDAMAAKLMGFNPLEIKFIRLAHERGLGCGDPRQIEIVGDVDAAGQNWHFVGPFKKMTFASSMQHKIYWGPLKGPVEWSLKTWLAPWAYIASVLYHDLYWYPRNGKERVERILSSDWGRLFANWEKLAPDERGWPEVGMGSAKLDRSTLQLIAKGIGILGTCISEAPETRRIRNRKIAAPAPAVAK